MNDSYGKLDAIEQQIVNVLEKIAAGREQLSSNAAWTKRIKDELVNVGQGLGYNSYASGCSGADGGEWLFDLCWLEVDRVNVNKNVLRAPLILESEWHRNGRMDDFPKLIIARAEHRVFIHEAKNEADKVNVHKKLIDAIKQSKLTMKGDRYLLACWDLKMKKFMYDQYVA